MKIADYIQKTKPPKLGGLGGVRGISSSLSRSVIQDSRVKFAINPMNVPIFFKKQIWYKFQIMLKKQRNSENCNFSYQYLAVPVCMIFLKFIILTHLYQL